MEMELRTLNTFDASIKTSTVEINQLVIANRKMTISILKQIPEKRIINHDNLTLRGVPWGFVNYYWKDNEKYKDNYYNLLWAEDGALRRCFIPKEEYYSETYPELDMNKPIVELVKKKERYKIEDTGTYIELPFALKTQIVDYSVRDFIEEMLGRKPTLKLFSLADNMGNFNEVVEAIKSKKYCYPSTPFTFHGKERTVSEMIDHQINICWPHIKQDLEKEKSVVIAEYKQSVMIKKNRIKILRGYLDQIRNGLEQIYI